MIARVPVVMQMEALECGAACLAMVLAYHGKWLALEQVRADCGVSRDGSNAKNILAAARSYGMEAAGYRLEVEDARKLDFPVIVHWNFNHFVVLCGFRGDRAILNDPARGRVTVSAEEFDRAFTGIAICCAPGSGFQREGRRASVVGYAKKRLAGNGSLLLFAMLWSLVAAAVSLVIPLFSKLFLDDVLSGAHPEWLEPLLAAMAGVLVFQLVTAALQNIYWMRIQGKMSVQASASFFWHVLRLPVSFFAQRYIGDIAARQESNGSITSTLMGKIAPVAVNVCLLVVYLAVMLQYSVALSCIGIATVAVNLGVMQLVSARRVNATRAIERDEGLLGGMTMSGLDMIESIKAAGAEAGFFQRWSGTYARVHNGAVALAKANQYYNMIPQLLQQLANTAVLMLGVFLIMEGEMTIGALLAFQGFLSSFLAPVNEIVQLGSAVVEMRTQMERIEDVYHYETDVPDEAAAPEAAAEKLAGAVEMRHVTFGYAKLAPPLVRDFSLRVEPGHSVAFVGATGSGKSTMAKLISGLYPPWEGEILLDGRPRGEIPREVLTESLSVVDQDIILFEDTVARNVTMWDDDIPQADIIEACKAAEIHEDIMQRPEGYGHVVKDGGANFSGGQRQRLEIARALVRRPSILILDEATSALDAQTEQRIMENLKARGITLIIVAHRLSTIRDCDEIIVLDGGRVCQRGTHGELMDVPGPYRNLVKS